MHEVLSLNLIVTNIPKTLAYSWLVSPPISICKDYMRLNTIKVSLMCMSLMSNIHLKTRTRPITKLIVNNNIYTII